MKRYLWLAPFAGIAGFLGVWELFVRVFDIESYKLPRPSDVVRDIVTNRSAYWYDAWPTIAVSVAGFALALVVAFTGAFFADCFFFTIEFLLSHPVDV